MKFLPFDEISIPVKITRQNRKSVRFKYVGTTCHISAPFFVSDEQIKGFCLEKKTWLIKTYQKVSRIEDFSQRNMILGKELKLVFHYGQDLAYELIEDELHITKNNRFSEESAYQKVKEMMAFDIILKILAEESMRMNVKIHSVNLRTLKASWGRCNSKKDITLSYKLIEYPIDFIRYVCIHELAHTFEMNHSSAFWKIVENYCPNYKVIKKMSTYTL